MTTSLSGKSSHISQQMAKLEIIKVFSLMLIHLISIFHSKTIHNHCNCQFSLTLLMCMVLKVHGFVHELIFSIYFFVHIDDS